MKPDFICIGPEKTGTTWLFSMLHGHPQVWLPPYKELRFLTEGNLVPEHSLKNLFFNSHWHCKELRRVLLRNTVKLFLLRKTENFEPLESFQWVLKYMFGKHDFAWYASLFDNSGDKICGDITPNYYHIPEARIAELHRHNPDAKILLFVRNPIERSWSNALMNYCDHDGRAYESVSQTEWLSMLDEFYAYWQPYHQVIAQWQKYFPDMHIAYFDRLKEDADDFFQEIADFLGIDASMAQKQADKIVGKGVGKAMPEYIQEHLLEQYGQEIKVLSDSGVSPYPQQWLQALKV